MLIFLLTYHGFRGIMKTLKRDTQTKQKGDHNHD
nr:MAG TPA: NAD(P)H-quinone oxidoreductase subunit 1 [Caudoviricetes sp.]